MRKAILVGLLAFVTLLYGQKSLPTSDWEHMLWIDGTLTAIKSVQVGMSQKELDRLFAPEGGLHSGVWATEGIVTSTGNVRTSR